MKLILTMTMFFGAALAHADSFTIIRDGNTYLCEQQGPIDPGGNVQCVDKAYSGPFSRDEAMRLCTGAHDESPALCGAKAYAGPFSKEESIGLCIGAHSVGPAECAAKAYSGPFSKAESLDLCQKGTVANADCAIKAYAGPYSKEESIRLCKSNPALILKSLNLLEQSGEIQEKIRSMKKEQ